MQCLFENRKYDVLFHIPNSLLDSSFFTILDTVWDTSCSNFVQYENMTLPGKQTNYLKSHF